MWLWKALKGVFAPGSAGGLNKVAEVADEAFHTEQERAQEDLQDTAAARNMQFGSHDSWFDIAVDGFNRMVRPAFAMWAFGELVGWWRVVTVDISPEKMNLILLIITFYFGGRAVLKDLPSLIKSLRK